MTMTNEMPYTFHFLEASTETLRAIAHPQRLLIMDMLFHEKSLNVTEIYEKLGVVSSSASRHEFRPHGGHKKDGSATFDDWQRHRSPDQNGGLILVGSGKIVALFAGKV
ncbi:MAG: ArsR/SmtB family transcription factor, partial [Bacteroidota bacterium]